MFPTPITFRTSTSHAFRLPTIVSGPHGPVPIAFEFHTSKMTRVHYISISNSMICSDIWHKHIRNFINRLGSETWDNFEISRVLYMPNITYKQGRRWIFSEVRTILQMPLPPPPPNRTSNVPKVEVTVSLSVFTVCKMTLLSNLQNSLPPVWVHWLQHVNRFL